MARALNKRLISLTFFKRFRSATPSCYTPKCRELNKLGHKIQMGEK